jgi:2-methylisocitrate lyase-like PEP mutase family enzyme
LSSLRKPISGNELIVAPVTLNPIMARLAEAAGFKAIYLRGGTARICEGIAQGFGNK